MNTSSGAAIGSLLERYCGGDSAALDELHTALYPELKNIARRHMRALSGPSTLSTTALVHEAYLSAVKARSIASTSRNQFLAFASRVMRNIVVDHVRERLALKRGNGHERVELSEEDGATTPDFEHLLALDQALETLAHRDPRLLQIVECRYFGGLTSSETAEALGVSLRTVEREWARARAHLHRLLGGSERPSA